MMSSGCMIISSGILVVGFECNNHSTDVIEQISLGYIPFTQMERIVATDSFQWTALVETFSKNHGTFCKLP